MKLIQIFLAALVFGLAPAVQSQELMLFPASTFGKVVAPQNQTLVDDVLLEAQVGDYNNEFVANYGENSVFARTGRSVGMLQILTNIGHAPCTAFLVKGNKLITNYHCVPGVLDNPRMKERGARTIAAVQFHAGFFSDGVDDGVKSFFVDPVPIEANEDLDYSVLQVLDDANTEFGALELSASQPDDRAPFWVIGHPMGEAQRISREKCQASTPAISSGRLRHTCDTLPGNSGSPVIDPESKFVVALHHAGSRAGDVNYAIPMVDILKHSKVLNAASPPQSRVARPRDDVCDGQFILAKQLNQCAVWNGYLNACSAHEGAVEAKLSMTATCAEQSLTDAIALSDRTEKMAALKSLEAAFAGKDIAKRARVALNEMEAMDAARRAAEERAVRDRRAFSAIANALAIPTRTDRIAALEKVIEEFAGTEAAEGAIQTLERERTVYTQEVAAQQQRAEEEKAVQQLKMDAAQALKDQQALSAFSDAMLLDDPAVQLEALQAIIADFEDTSAAERAKQALEVIALSAEDDRSSRQQAIQIEREKLGLARIADALSLAERSKRLLALEGVTVEFAGTEAASRASLVLQRERAAQLQEEAEKNYKADFATKLEQRIASLMVELDSAKDDVSTTKAEADARVEALNAALDQTRLALATALRERDVSQAKQTIVLTEEQKTEKARFKCFASASSPFDIQRDAKTPGIAFEEILVLAAKDACSHPDAKPSEDAGVLFSLGRVNEAGENFQEAFNYYNIASSLDYIAASTALGRFYRDGIAVEKDMNKAIVFFESAAKRGDPAAMVFLSEIYETKGGAVLRDYAKAIYYLDEAINLNHPHAYFNKAEAYRKGTLFGEDLKVALDLYKISTELGDHRALYETAMIFWQGVDGAIVTDKPKALQLLQEAAQQGNSAAQVRLGNIYLKGSGLEAGVKIDRNFNLAKRWLSEAARGGYVQAQMQLGQIFEEGVNGEQSDLSEALYWYEAAARQDFGQAIVKVARMYEAGQGVDPNPSKAADYWNRSMQLGLSHAKNRRDEWEIETAKSIQRILKEEGHYSGPIDGKIGPGTNKAINSYTFRSSFNVVYIKSGARMKVKNQGWNCQC